MTRTMKSKMARNDRLVSGPVTIVITQSREIKTRKPLLRATGISEHNRSLELLAIFSSTKEKEREAKDRKPKGKSQREPECHPSPGCSRCPTRLSRQTWKLGLGSGTDMGMDMDTRLLPGLVRGYMVRSYCSCASASGGTAHPASNELWDVQAFRWMMQRKTEEGKRFQGNWVKR